MANHERRLHAPELPNFTITPNIHYDEWLPTIKSLAELKVIEVVCRQTFGWHRDISEGLSISEMEKLTGMSRTSVIEGIKLAGPDGHDILERVAVGRSYRYKLKLKPLLQLVKPDPITIYTSLLTELVPPPEDDLPDSPESVPSDSQEFGLSHGPESVPSDSTDSGPMDSTESGLLLKINRVNKTHTNKGADSDRLSQNDTPENGTKVCVSLFSREEIKEYAIHQKTPLGIGWVNKAEDTGKWDRDIADWFEAKIKKNSPQPTGLIPVTPPDPKCTICHGSGKFRDSACACTICRKCGGTGMEVVEGKGARKCECRTKTREFRRTG